MQVFVKPRGHKVLHKLDQVHCLSSKCSLSYPVCYIQYVCIIVISLRGISCLFIQPVIIDHFEGQRFNLIWSNVKKKFSILLLTRFVLHQCTTPFDIFKHVKYHKKAKAKHTILQERLQNTIPKSQKDAKYLTLTRKYMTAHFHGLQDSIVQ